MSQRLFKCLGVFAVIISFTGIAFASSKAERNFSIFDEDYSLIWSYEDFSSISFSSFTDGHDKHGKHNWHNDDGRDKHAGPVAPEPVSSTLFIIGGATLGFRHFRKKRRTGKEASK